uniref:Putative secreted protein n=1 Tax=Anopheles marajoara TaxID=58244 RepID=A0A2M4CEB7_9DIPT
MTEVKLNINVPLSLFLLLQVGSEEPFPFSFHYLKTAAVADTPLPNLVPGPNLLVQRRKGFHCTIPSRTGNS